MKLKLTQKNKDREISVDSLNYGHTYGGIYACSNRGFTNATLILETFPNHLKKMWGEDRVYLFVDKDNYYIYDWLPPIVVYAWLVSPKEIGDKPSGGSHLFLIWLQEDTVDPFLRLTEIMETIDWEKEARDFDY